MPCQRRQFTCAVICNRRMEGNFTAHVAEHRCAVVARPSKRMAVIVGIKTNEFVLW